jgi:hypothetical protein
VPPVFSIKTAFIVFGRDDIFLIPSALGPSCWLNEANRADVIDEVESSRVVRAARETRVMEFEASDKLRAKKTLDRWC